MKKTITLGTLALAAVLAHAQAPLQWERSFGGADSDFAGVVRGTTDGGYVAGGFSYSDASGAKTAANYGSGDNWIVKLDASGTQQWDKSFGGVSFDGINALEQTADGGYILGGISFSDPSGNKASTHYGAGDFWIVKLNSSGSRQWDKSFGGNSNDVLQALQQTSDGGYILGGISFSGVSGNKISTSHGGGDYWVVKLDASGNKQWERSFGGQQSDELHSLRQTTDGGYVFGGHSFSGVSGNKTSANFGSDTSDYWVVKLDASGNKQWERSFGGDDAEEMHSVEQTADGGFLLGGHSYSGGSGNKSAGNHGSHDYWVVKLDANGNKQWDRSYGGADADELRSAQQTADSGYILGGFSSSGLSGNRMTTNSDSCDYWMVKIDAAGNKQWEQSIRGNYAGALLRLQKSSAGGYVLAGLASSIASTPTDCTVAKLSVPLHVHSLEVRSNRSFQAQSSGIPGTDYILHASTNLVTWLPVLTNRAAPDGLINFLGTNSVASAKRFFQVRPQ